MIEINMPPKKVAWGDIPNIREVKDKDVNGVEELYLLSLVNIMFNTYLMLYRLSFVISQYRSALTN